jgi:hypothetical protein
VTGMAYGLKSRHRIGVSRCPLLPQKRSVVLLQTLHDVVGDEMTLIFGETLAQSPHRLATPPMSANAIANHRVCPQVRISLNIKGTVGNNFAVVN